MSGRRYPKKGRLDIAEVRLEDGTIVKAHLVSPKVKAWRKAEYLRSVMHAYAGNGMASAYADAMQDLDEHVIRVWVERFENLVDDDGAEIETGAEAIERCTDPNILTAIRLQAFKGTALSDQEKKVSSSRSESSGTKAEVPQSGPTQTTGTGESEDAPQPAA